MKNYIVLFLLFFLSFNSLAQNSDRIFKSASMQNGGILDIEVIDGRYRIQFYNSKIIETSFIPKGEDFKENSHAVVLKSNFLDIKLKESSSFVNFSSKGIKVKVQKVPFKISYFYKEKEVTSEKNRVFKRYYSRKNSIKPYF